MTVKPMMVGRHIQGQVAVDEVKLEVLEQDRGFPGPARALDPNHPFSPSDFTLKITPEFI
jgi:hypothetical protein